MRLSLFNRLASSLVRGVRSVCDRKEIDDQHRALCLRVDSSKLQTLNDTDGQNYETCHYFARPADNDDEFWLCFAHI